MIDYKLQAEALSDPFEESDIEWRIQMSGVKNGKPWAMVIPYVDNRAIQHRLDQVFGFDGWRNEYRETSNGSGFLCGLSFRNDKGEWITKWDGAEYTQVEPLKGALSGSMKRAAVQLGIGRYLYGLREDFAEVKLVNSRYEVVEPWTYASLKEKDPNDSKKVIRKHHAKWLPPKLPEWALPRFEKDKLLNDIKSSETLESLKTNYAEAKKYSDAFDNSEFREVAVKATNERMAELQAAVKSTGEGKASEMLKWTQDQIEKLVTEATNASVVKQVSTKLASDIESRCDELGIKPDVYLQVLRAQYSRRLKELSPNAAQEG